MRLLVATVGASVVCATVDAQFPTTAATDAKSQLSTQQQRQLQVFGPILLNASADIDPDTRRNAAHELLAMGGPDAMGILDDALRSQKPAVMLATISALHTSKPPPAELMETAILALSGAPAETLEPLSWLVARYGEPALQAVGELAADHDADSAGRLGPIYALGAFHSRNAAARLVQLLDSSTSPSPDDIKAACDSLARLSGLSFDEPEQWRQWWSEAANLPNDAWFQLIADSLSARAAELQQRLERQREAGEQASRELVNTFRDLFPSLSTDEQIRRLPKLLEDRLATVREFALSRATLLVRDSIRIPVELQQKLAEQLGDEEPALRVRAAKLLDEMNFEMTGAAVAARLNVEKSPQAIAGLLEVLARRPAPAGLEPAQRLLSDADLGGKAGDAIWRILENSAVSDDQLATLRASAREALRQRSSPAAARVLASVGNDADMNDMIALLHGGDATLRSAVAQGFCRRGLRQPLIERASDESVYRYAVQVVADGPAELANVRLLATLKPTEANRRIWCDGILKIVCRLNPAQFQAADDLLAPLPYATTTLRRDILLKGAALPREQLPTELRTALLVRLAPLLMQLGQAAQAYELLESVNGDSGSDALRAARFQAAVLTGRFDKAASLQTNPKQWIELLAQTVQRDHVAAALLRDEIVRRFAGKLAQQDQAQLNQVVAALEQASSAAAADSESPPR